MYCTKCGRKADPGDQYCAGCGTRLKTGATAPGTPEAKRCTLLPWILLAVTLVILAVSMGKNREKEDQELVRAPVSQQTQPATQPPALTPEQELQIMLAELNQHDLNPEPSFWDDSTVRRTVEPYGDNVWIQDFLSDGTLIRFAEVCYDSSGQYTGKRVIEYDLQGFMADEKELMADGSVWMHIPHANTYDEQGRAVSLCSFNRAGQPLTVQTFLYREDGSFVSEFSEYRGAIYEYDFEENPEGTTSLWYHSITEYSADAEILSEVCDVMDGFPVEE